MSVLLFHFGVDLVPGGYVGVDVFFVISGFLITRLIVDSFESGTFGFGEFYIRRVRRLFPALFFTIVVTFLAAVSVFSPDHLERLGGSTLYALLSVSNFFFWGESGYFDASSAVKPLLHFWSLGVEEQFYLVWPFTLVALLSISTNRFFIPAFVILIGSASLALAHKWMDIDTTAVFFLLPFRIVEFAFGALLVWLPDLRKKSHLFRELILALGLFLIIYSVLSFDDETNFPGPGAVMPCLGTSLAIFAGKPKLLGRFLASKPLVFIGLISYSLYLCHWPIYVFFRYLNSGAEITSFHVAGLTVISVVFATLMYRFVERPFRFVSQNARTQAKSARFGLVCALLCLVMVLPAAHTWANRGWTWRYGNVGEDLSQLFDLDKFRFESIRFSQERVLSASFTSGRRKVLVVGDSHARDVSNGLVQSLPSERFEVRMEVLDHLCLRYLTPEGRIKSNISVYKPQHCEGHLQNYAVSAKVRRADVIVFSASFGVRSANLVDRFIKLTSDLSSKKNMTLIIMDKTVVFEEFHSEAIRMMSGGMGFEEVNARALRFAEMSVLDEVHSALQKSSLRFTNVSLIAKRPLICGDTGCLFFLTDGTLAIWDSTHWTVAGAKTFMDRLVESQLALFEPALPLP